MKLFLKSFKLKKSASIVTSIALLAGFASFVTPAASAAPVGAGFVVSESDLAYILDQIKIAEAHAATLNPDGSVKPGTNPYQPVGATATDIPNNQLALGLRQIDGRNNNLTTGFSSWNGFEYVAGGTVGKSTWGSAGQPFKRTTPVSYKGLFGTGGTRAADGHITDNEIRTISNLIADQSSTNPAATAAANKASSGAEEGLVSKGTNSYVIPNVAVNAGVNAPNNGIFSLFGQFFDHGLDLVGKSSTQKIKVCLKSDDPLYNAENPGPQCMSTGRSILNEAYDGTNSTTPWVDQNQTYSSHPSKQVFLREYNFSGATPTVTGKLLGDADGNIATWAQTKAQALQLGIELRDSDITAVPLLVTNEFGRFLPGPNGNPQLVKIDGTFIEGTLAAPVNTDGIRKTNQAFLDDINPYAFPYTGVSADEDDVITVQDPNSPPPNVYDNELLDAHFITGDGRGNENIGLTAIHTIFHSEHDRLVDDIKNTISLLSNASPVKQALLAGFGSDGTGWNGERLFQAAKFVNEMEYQHIVFGEFARSVQPAITPFAAYDSTLDPTITEEFANAAYRYGHSQLNADILRTDAQGNNETISLFDGFLSPDKFNATNQVTRLNASESAGLVFRGMAKQTGNSIDEFVTSTLRNTLLGSPLDLATLNIARSRDTGLASLNEARAAYKLITYKSWFDFGQHMQTIESLPNFIAAYGNLPEIKAEPSIAGKRALGEWVVNCATSEANCSTAAVIAASTVVDFSDVNLTPAYSADFFNARNGSTAQNTGLNDIDLWMGGLAEKHQTRAPGASQLGSTLDYIFKTQLENLQGSDRFYYLGRTAGMQLAGQLETNFFSELVMRNTDVSGLPANAFAVASNTIDLNQSCESQIETVRTSQVQRDTPGTLTCQTSAWVYRGNQHLVWDGTTGEDVIYSGGGNDTLIGGAGSDHLYGNFGDDFLYGGEGNDFLYDDGGIDIYIGGSGDDYFEGGAGGDTFNGGAGDDFVFAGYDATVTLAGEGNDYVHGGTGADGISGDEGNDWLDGGGTADGIIGDLLAPFVGFISSFPGDNVMIGGAGPDSTTGGDGTDVNLSGEGTDLYTGGFGFDWETSYVRGDSSSKSFDLGLAVPVAGSFGLEDTFLDVEGGSGGDGNDIIIGDLRTVLLSITPPFTDGLLASEVDKITNLRALVNKGGNNTSEWLNGNILLGGNGSDRLTGHMGDDRIDGDAYLEVGLSIPAASVTGSTAGFYADPDNADRLMTQDISLLQPLVASGDLITADIMQIKVIRAGDGTTGIDTAVFAGAQADYTITYNRDGSITVVDNIVGRDGTDTLTGIEVLDFAGALVNVALPTITATGVTGGAKITWTAPLTANRQPVVSYTVRAYTALTGGSLVGTSCTVLAPRSCVITGLDNGTPYFVDVTTTTSFGSNTTARVRVVPVIVPEAPANVSSSSVAATSATITWDAAVVPTDGPTVTGYTVTFVPAIGGAAQCVNIDALTCSVTRLAPNTRYTATVVANSAVGSSLDSAVIEVLTPPSVAPTAPRNLAVTINGSSATLNWRAPNANGGGAVAPTYDVSVVSTAPTAPTLTCSALSVTTCAVADLTAGYSYTFTVTATNSVGTSPAATRTVTIVTGPPSSIDLAPVVTRTSNTRIRVTWTAPPAIGNPATAYIVTVTPAPTIANPTPAVITGRVTSSSLTPSTTVRVTGTGTVTVTPLNSASVLPYTGTSPAGTY